jgi:acetylornithine deacetylase
MNRMVSAPVLILLAFICILCLKTESVAGLNEREKIVVDTIDAKRGEIIEALSTLIKIPSRTGDEGELQELQAKTYKKMGMEVDVWEIDLKDLFAKFPEIAQYPTRWQPELDLVIGYPGPLTYEYLMKSTYDSLKSYKGRPNVVGVLKGTGGGKSIILNGHADTVTLGDESAWKYKPFGAEIVGNKMYGRGATDMKSGLVAANKAIEYIISSGAKLRGDVILQSVVNEEHAGNGSLGTIARGYKADAVIVNEGGGGGSGVIRTDSGGAMYFEIRTTGRDAHTGSRWRVVEGVNKPGEPYGVSAIEKMAMVISALSELEKDLNAKYGMGAFQLGTGIIKGGSYATSSPRDCMLQGVMYYNCLPQYPEFMGVKGMWNVWGLMNKAIQSVSEKDPWLKEHPPVITTSHYDDAYKNNPEDSIVKTIQEAYRDLTSKEVKVALNGFESNYLAERERGITDLVLALIGVGTAEAASDVRHFGNSGKMSVVSYGPKGGAGHAVDEYVDIDDLVLTTKVLALTVVRWCN